MNKIICIIALAFSIVGCASVDTRPTTVGDTAYNAIPSNLLIKCWITAPPNKDLFANASAEKKLDMMTKYADTLLGDLDNCNIRMSEIRIANDKKDALFNKGPGSK